jgi:hypothetical protein
MKNPKYHTVGIISTSNKKKIETDKLISLAHKYMTTHIPGMVQALLFLDL